MQDRLQEIRDRANKATPSPWETDEKYTDSIYCDDSTGSIIAKCPSNGVLRNPLNINNNAEFIAHARQDVPYLLDVIQQSQEENKKLTLARGQAEHFKKLAQLNIDKYFESANREQVLRDALVKINNRKMPYKHCWDCSKIAKQALGKDDK